MKRNDWLILAMYGLIIAAGIMLLGLYIKGILSDDIPWWLKLHLLRGK